jgi:hypothetical protein
MFYICSCMSEQPSTSSQAPHGVVDDFARAALERQMAGLDELADVGRAILRGLAKIVAREAEAAKPDPGFDVAAIRFAHDRTARAVRLTYALQHKVIDLLRGVGRIEIDQAEKAERARAAEARAREAAARANDPVHVRKLQIGKVVDGIITDAHDGDGEAIDRHVRETERLRDHEVLDNVLSRPTSEVIADICRLLGLEPNWEGLAFEAWAVEERKSGKVGEPLKSPPPWTGKRPGVRGRVLKSEPPPVTAEADIEDTPAPPPSEPEPEPEVALATPPYIPPPDPDILPGYPVGLPGEYPPERRDGRRPRPMPPPKSYTYGFD